MQHSRSVQDHVRDSEDRDFMLFSAWLLACALLLTLGTQVQTPSTSTAREL